MAAQPFKRYKKKQPKEGAPAPRPNLGSSALPTVPAAETLAANARPGEPSGPINLDEAINPYNFVPLSRYVWEPDWAVQVSHDHPFEDGWSGHIAFRVEAVTPVLIASGAEGRGRERRPLTIDGRFALPSTSLLGMVRNVVEIAAFGRMMRGVEERGLAMRNVDNQGYRDLVPAARVKAGWLRRDITGWCIEPCAHARLNRVDSAIKSIDAQVGKQQPGFGTSSVFADTGERTPPPGLQQPIFESAVKGVAGVAVKTGFIQPRQGEKREYLFFAPTGARIAVHEAVYASFDAAHSSNPAWRDQGTGQAARYQLLLQKGEKIPVFYLADGESATHVGLAAMFRVMMPTTLHQAIGNMQPVGTAPDLACLMFGQHDALDGPLRGRVSFSHAFAEGKLTVLDDGNGGPWVTAILSTPKPTFHPAYIQQRGEPKRLTSLMDKTSVLSGWKRYPVGGSPSERARLPGNDNEDVISKIFPLQAGSVFRGKIHVHNLRRIELGALLWALGWGRTSFPPTPGTPDFLHSLGMGKPLGLGQVRISYAIEAGALMSNEGAEATADLAAEAVRAFEERMNAFLLTHKAGPWRETEQIRELLAMADPETVRGREGQLGYLALKQHRDTRPVGGKSRRPLGRHSAVPNKGGTWRAG